jgi:methionine-rich copper-binding protein CopC
MTLPRAGRLRRALALLLALPLLVMPGAARAHAYPEHADPKVGSTISGSPTQVRIWFDSEIEPAFSSIEVHGTGGTAVPQENGRVDPSDPKLLEVSIPQRLAPGTYKVTWSVVARDGHRTSGDYEFTVRG